MQNRYRPVCGDLVTTAARAEPGRKCPRAGRVAKISGFSGAQWIGACWQQLEQIVGAEAAPAHEVARPRRVERLLALSPVPTSTKRTLPQQPAERAVPPSVHSSPSARLIQRREIGGRGVPQVQPVVDDLRALLDQHGELVFGDDGRIEAGRKADLVHQVPESLEQLLGQLPVAALSPSRRAMGAILCAATGRLNSMV